MKQSQETTKNPTITIPILITSSIIPHDTGVKLLDPQKRLFHAIESIEQWIRVAPESRLVLCDGSGFDFEPIIRERFSKARIECLTFNNDESIVSTYGRGYGEGEIIKFALNNSQFLRETTAFAKCSSKLWVENYAMCARNFDNSCAFQGVFTHVFSMTKPAVLEQVDTRFYFMNREFYSKNFIDAHKAIDLKNGCGLEDVFFKILMELKQAEFLLPRPLQIRGVGGGIGTYYKYNYIRLIKENLRLEISKRSTKFLKFFKR